MGLTAVGEIIIHLVATHALSMCTKEILVSVVQKVFRWCVFIQHSCFSGQREDILLERLKWDNSLEIGPIYPRDECYQCEKDT